MFCYIPCFYFILHLFLNERNMEADIQCTFTVYHTAECFPRVLSFNADSNPMRQILY